MSESGQLEPQLTLKARLNFPYLLANQILTFQKSLLALEYSEREIRETIRGFLHLIPNDWKDKQFHDEVKAAKTTQVLDKRPLVAGNIRMDKATCEAMGIEPFQRKVVLDYYLIFQACINLLNRRGMVSKINLVEQIEDINFAKIAKDVTREDSLSS